MQTGYTQLDAEEREAVRTNGVITGQLLSTAARLTRQALDRGLEWLQNRTRPPTELELTRSQQQAADIIAVTTERCGSLQDDGSFAFETEQYRFSVTPDGIYSAVDKGLNWTVFEFQRDRAAVQEKAAALAELAADYGDDYTPEAAVAATSGAIDDLFTVIDGPDVEMDHAVPSSPVVATSTLESVVDDRSPMASPPQAMPLATAELTEPIEKAKPGPAAGSIAEINNGNQPQTMAVFFANLVDSRGQIVETNPVSEVETTSEEVSIPEVPTQALEDPWFDAPISEPTAEIADELVEFYGEPVQPKPPKRYAGEIFDILQNNNRYEVRDKAHQTLFSFEKHGNQYHIIEDNLTDEQRQQFSRIHTRTQSVGLNQVMADPTGNSQLHYLEDLAPEGSKAISFAHQQLDLAHTNQLDTQSQGIIRREDQSLVIFDKTDHRVIASSTAKGEISSQMTSKEKAMFAQAWRQTHQQQTVSQYSRSADLER